MMRLLRVELTRFRSRRLNQVALLGAFAIALLLVFISWTSSRPPSADRVAEYNTAAAYWEETGDKQIADCYAGEAAERETDPEAYWGCDTYMAPELEHFTSRSPSFADNAADVLPGFGFVLIFAGFVMGVSFIAAEFSSGAIGNWLTFEPRRGRVLGAKIGASGIAMIPFVVVMGTVIVAGVWLANSLNDHVGTLTGETWKDVGASGLRLILLTIGCAVIGVAVGTIVRHTAAAIGIVVGYMIVVEGLLANFIQGLRPWLLDLNMQAVLQNGATYSVSTCESGPYGMVCDYTEETLSFASGAVNLSVLLVVVVVVAALVFRRRDVN